MKQRRRKAIPDGVKLDAALRRFGLTRDMVRFDHNPALELRRWNDLTGDTIPPANDAAYIDMLLVEEHDAKTFGPGGEKRITTAGSDINRIAKVRRISKAQEEFQAKLLAKGSGDTAPDQKKKPKRKIQSRGFDKRSKTKSTTGR